MAGSTYLSLTNQALVLFNEVPLTSGTFSSATGLQALAKNAVNYSINHIYQTIRQLPWAYTRDTSITTSIGTTFYTWPTNTLEVDYDGICLEADAALDLDFTVLKQIQHEVWKRTLQAADENTLAANYQVPSKVFRTPDNKIGITGPPADQYTLVVPLWAGPVQLSTLVDTTDIPSIYDLVILDGTIYYIYKLRHNEEAITRQKKDFDDSIKSLRAATTNKYLSMQDTRVS